MMFLRLTLAVITTAALSLFALNAPAQFNGCAAGFCGSPATSAAYSGPGDITSGAIAFYSAGRAYNLAYAQALSAAADVVDTATGLTTCTFHFLSTGFVNKTECNATACATACSVTKLYDQTKSNACNSGSCDVIQATLSKMPGLTFNAQNGLPCAVGTGNASVGLVTAANLVSQNVPYTATLVGERTGSFTTQQRAFQAAPDVFSRWNNSANQMSVSAGTSVALTAADNAFHATLTVASATAPLFAIDSSANTSTSTSGTTAINGPFSVVGTGSTLALLSGFVCEAGFWPADLNSSYQAMLANMRSATNGWNF
jgi:hypothetical protein